MKDTFIKWAIDKDFCFLSDFDKTGYSYKDTWLGNTTSLNFTKIRQKTKTKCFIKPISQMGRYVFCEGLSEFRIHAIYKNMHSNT